MPLSRGRSAAVSYPEHLVGELPSTVSLNRLLADSEGSGEKTHTLTNHHDAKLRANLETVSATLSIAVKRV